MTQEAESTLPGSCLGIHTIILKAARSPNVTVGVISIRVVISRVSPPAPAKFSGLKMQEKPEERVFFSLSPPPPPLSW